MRTELVWRLWAHGRQWLTILRERQLGILISIVCWFVYQWLYEKTPASHAAGSDGFYSWIYARSLAFDHDIEFKNDYALCGDPARLGIDRGTGHPDNPFYSGPALFWVPILVLAKKLVHVSSDAPESVRFACHGILAKITLGTAPIFAALTIYIAYLAARELVSDGSAALSAAIFGFGSHLMAYASMLPSYSHVYEALSASVLVWSITKIHRHPKPWKYWILAGLAVSACTLQRLANAVFIFAPIAIALQSRIPHVQRISIAVIGSVFGSIGVITTAFMYRYLYGSIWVVPQGKHFLFLRHAHPWLLLFAHRGLFYTMPIAWLSIFGLVPALRKRDDRFMIFSWCFIAALVVYIASSAWDWHASASFGARRLLVLLPMMIVLGAYFIQAAQTFIWRSAKRIQIFVSFLILLPILGLTIGQTWGLPSGRTPMDKSLKVRELYGPGSTILWELVEEHFGEISIWPAELVYQVRYGLPMNTFILATEDRYYARSYRDLSWQNKSLSLSDEELRKLTTNFATASTGSRIAGQRATLVFHAKWPYATHLVVHGKAEKPSTVTIGFGTLWRTKRIGSITLGPSAQKSELPIPAGIFDSGMNEVVFEVDKNTLDNNPTIEFIEFDDRAYRSPPYAK